jgi:SAM-dependent methyltransferase
MGCGEGRLLLELLERFGAHVEIHGLNHPKWPVMFGSEPLLRSNEHYRVMSAARLRSLPLPTIHAADVQDLSAFPVRDFDLIFSQAVLPHVADKARALEYSAQLLAPDGIFAHELDRIDLPPLDFLDTDLPRFTIYEGRARISTTDYLRSSGIELLHCSRKGFPGTLAVYRNPKAATAHEAGARSPLDPQVGKHGSLRRTHALVGRAQRLSHCAVSGGRLRASK